ncbi:MAG: cupredoxin domain-containing protein, partial [Candidatus Roizmanbacteria bacterium]
SPVFFGIGWLTEILGDNFKSNFSKIAAIAVLDLGITSLYGALIVGGFISPLKLNTMEKKVFSTSSNAKIHDVNITIASSGYSPRQISVKQGEKVRLHLKSTDAFSCASAFRRPSLNIAVNLGPNDAKDLEFIASNKGPIPFTCSMGMYTGEIEVL